MNNLKTIDEIKSEMNKLWKNSRFEDPIRIEITKEHCLVNQSIISKIPRQIDPLKPIFKIAYSISHS